MTIIDAGLPRYWTLLSSELTRLGLTLDDVRALILTHGDTDHIGFAARLSREKGIPAYLHPADADRARLDEYLISFVVEPSLARTVFASSFASTLELVREGLMEVHQQTAFAPLYVRKSRPRGDDEADAGGRAAPEQAAG